MCSFDLSISFGKKNVIDFNGWLVVGHLRLLNSCSERTEEFLRASSAEKVNNQNYTSFEGLRLNLNVKRPVDFIFLPRDLQNTFFCKEESGSSDPSPRVATEKTQTNAPLCGLVRKG